MVLSKERRRDYDRLATACGLQLQPYTLEAGVSLTYSIRVSQSGKAASI